MQNRPPASSLFTQVDISAGSVNPQPTASGWSDEQTQLLRQILEAQDRQNELLEEVVSQLGAAQRQRQQELSQWRQANPELSRSCRGAAEALSKVQTAFLASLTDEVRENAEGYLEGEFLLNEFVDRFGPRLAHLNGVLQVLSQLGSIPANNSANQAGS